MYLSVVKRCRLARNHLDLQELPKAWFYAKCLRFLDISRESERTLTHFVGQDDDDVRGLLQANESSPPGGFHIVGAFNSVTRRAERGKDRMSNSEYRTRSLGFTESRLSRRDAPLYKLNAKSKLVKGKYHAAIQP